MKKVYKIEVDCAVCASKVQDAVCKVSGVNSATVNFMTQKMVLDINDENYDEVYKQVVKAAKKVEPDFEVLSKWVKSSKRDW